MAHPGCSTPQWSRCPTTTSASAAAPTSSPRPARHPPRRSCAGSSASGAWPRSRCPTGCSWSTEFPVTGVGKTSKRELRAAIVSAQAGERAAPSGQRAHAGAASERAADAAVLAAEPPRPVHPTTARHVPAAYRRLPAARRRRAPARPGGLAARTRPGRAAGARHAALLPGPVRTGGAARPAGNIAALLRNAGPAASRCSTPRSRAGRSARERGLLTEFWGDGIGAVIDAAPPGACGVPTARITWSPQDGWSFRKKLWTGPGPASPCLNFHLFFGTGGDSRVRLATRPHNRFFLVAGGGSSPGNCRWSLRECWHVGKFDRPRGAGRFAAWPSRGWCRAPRPVRTDRPVVVFEVREPPGRARHRCTPSPSSTVDGEFTDRGIRTAAAVADLLRCTSVEARRLVAAAASVFPTSLTGEPLEPRLPATATALGGWEIDRAHAEVIERALSSDAAGRLDPRCGPSVETTCWPTWPGCTAR
jgi:hypothetical protein